MAPERVIDLSPSELLAAQLRALGVGADAMSPSTDDRVFSAFVDTMRESGSLVSIADIGKRLGVNPSTVALACRRMAQAGRMLTTKNPQTSRIAYVPVVEP